jgi:hypothetical protein
MEHKIKIVECTVFYSFLRMLICVSDSNTGEVILSARLVAVGVELDPNSRNQDFIVGPQQHGILEALINRATFPKNYDVLTNKGKHRVNCGDLVDVERQEYARTSLTGFLPILDEWRGQNPGCNPKVLDIGGQPRSGYLLSAHLRGCDVTVLDIRAAAGVVADIHSMIRHLSVGFRASCDAMEGRGIILILYRPSWFMTSSNTRAY